jgi:Uncharacterized conserved protein
MSGDRKRGYSPEDERDFAGPALQTMKRSAEELYFLLNRAYPMKGASTFIGNHYLLSERQRIALTRIVSSEKDIGRRKAKQKHLGALADETVNIDGFNQIITLEVAQSGSPIFRCMDGTYRDLAGLRGTYRLIDKTDDAIRSLISAVKKLCIKRAVFWLDAPVSNSGRLKTRIAEVAEKEQFEIEIEITSNVDRVLFDCANVISSDSIILNRCLSWVNLNEAIIPSIPDAWIIN